MKILQENKSNLIPISVSTISYLFFTILLLIPGRAIIGNPLYLVAITGMFICMIVLWKLVKSSKLFIFIILLSVVIRIFAIIQFPEGDDIYRYIWEGRIQLDGFNPYALAPDSEELTPLRTGLWKDINHKHIPTIYWPFAELLFKAGASVSHSIIFFKFMFTLWDLLTLLILFLLVKHFAVEKRHLLLYALNPLVIIFISGEGHLDSVVIFWIMLCLYFLQLKKYRLMYLSLGLALMTKFTLFFILPFLIGRKNIRYIPYLFLPALLFIPYLHPDVSFFSVPTLFTMEFRHNGLVYSLIHTLFDYRTSLYISFSIALILCICVFLLTPDTFRAVSVVTGIFLIFTPSFHPWYLLIMTPFLVFYRSWPWLILHLTILPLIFFFRQTIPETSFWRSQTLLMFIEYTPFVLLGFFWVFKNRRHWPVIFKEAETVSIIVPVLNEEENIAGCIESILEQNAEQEIIVVDGGSTDKTRSIAQSYNTVKLLESEAGRGLQIKRGIEQATGDIIVILHADSRLHSNTLEYLLNSLNNNPDAVGGSISAQYKNTSLPFRLTEQLNNLRTLWTGISFGDQAQFFRKEVIGNTFPPYKLMEDIELSFRVKEKGALLFLPKGIISSTRGWKERRYLNTFLKVIFLSSLFVVMRKLSLIRDNCEWFYRAYYGTK
jgi:hypothetical protein